MNASRTEQTSLRDGGYPNNSCLYSPHEPTSLCIASHMQRNERLNIRSKKKVIIMFKKGEACASKHESSVTEVTWNVKQNLTPWTCLPVLRTDDRGVIQFLSVIRLTETKWHLSTKRIKVCRFKLSQFCSPVTIAPKVKLNNWQRHEYSPVHL